MNTTALTNYNYTLSNDALILKSKLEKYDHIIFHSGMFHADEILATAYLMLVHDWLGIPFPKWERKNVISDEMTEENGYLVYDVGGGRFDHHFKEEDKQRRPNGIAYAAFGLIVREFHIGFLNDFEYQRFDRWVAPIDDSDNTGKYNPINDMFKCMNPVWDCPDPNINIRAANAISVGKDMIENKINRIRADYRAKAVLENAQDIERGVVYLDFYSPIGEYMFDIDGLDFFGAPSNRDIGKYNIIAAKDKDPNGVNKKLFPNKYRGLSNRSPNFEELHSESGMTFCHPGGFMATFDDKETAKRFFDKHYSEFEIPKKKEEAKE